jgi:hypothetical protein
MDTILLHPIIPYYNILWEVINKYNHRKFIIKTIENILPKKITREIILEFIKDKSTIKKI